MLGLHTRGQFSLSPPIQHQQPLQRVTLRNTLIAPTAVAMGEISDSYPARGTGSLFYTLLTNFTIPPEYTLFPLLGIVGIL